MYSILRTSSDPKVIGVKNGVYQAKLLKKGFSNNNYDILMEHWGGGDNWHERRKILPPTGVYLEYVKLMKSAIRTDFITICPNVNLSDLISKKVKDIFNEYNLYGVMYLDADVYDNGTKFQYSLCCIETIPEDWIDYSKVVLYEGLYFDKTRYFSKSFEDYSALQEEHFLLHFESTSLNSKFDQTIDLFRNLDGEIYISDRLKNDLVKNEISGVNLLPREDGMKWPIVYIND